MAVPVLSGMGVGSDLRKGLPPGTQYLPRQSGDFVVPLGDREV